MFKRSLLIYSIALSTPFLVWFVLWSLAQSTFHAHDPSPWIQNFVNEPGQSLQPDGVDADLGWVHINAEAGELFVIQQDQKIPLKQWTPTSAKIIVLAEAQGPQLASQLFHFLKENSRLKNSLILAVSDGFLKDVRYYDSEIALGAGQAYLVRFRALQTFALENFLSIQMSGVWLKPEIFKDSTQKLTDTFQAKKVPVFIGPVTKDQIASLPKNANYLITK